MRSRSVLLLLLLLLPGALAAQTTLRVMDYNLLNFPEPNPPGKQDTLAKILAYHPVDLLICEEIRTEAGAELVLDQSLNVSGETRFSMAQWEPMHSDPGADYDLQQIIYYDHNKFTLKEQGYLLTYVRDLNWYTLYVNDDDLAVTHDTTFLTVFAVHLKAGSESWNANERDGMAQVLVDFLPTLPPDRHVIVAGDMNLYSGFEDAFQTLINAGNAIVLEDPVNTIGGWSGNSFYSAVHTQSTRESAIYSDGAGGGLDDRFDIALCSSNLMDPGERLHVIDGTYRPLGNSGDCFNQNVTDCSTVLTPFAVLRSLYYMSDHLPLVFDLGFDGYVGLHPLQVPSPMDLSVMYVGDRWNAVVRSPRSDEATLSMYDAVGRCIHLERTMIRPGTTYIDLGSPADGAYIIALEGDAGRSATKAVLTTPY
jgi:hypothetical protein